MSDFNLAAAYITAITGDLNTVCDFRVINDKIKGEQGLNLRGTLTDLFNPLTEYNNHGYGVFMTVNAFGDDGRKTLENVKFIRAHVIDLDDVLTAQESYQRACQSILPPHIAVQSSPGKFHLYWLTVPYTGNDFYTMHQRKLVQIYGGDKQVVDATRVLRVPGFNHNKNEPVLVNCWGLSNNPRYTPQQMQDALSAVNIINVVSDRKPLGSEDLKAPSLDNLVQALNLLDPNTLSRDEWLPTSAAFKQAGWSLADEQTLFKIWSEWCGRYAKNDSSENLKLWRSIKDSQCGWSHFLRVTNIQAYINAAVSAPKEEELGVVLDAYGKQKWFENCFFVESEGRIFSPTGRFMNQTQFNGRYGGKEFCLKAAGGKTTDEAWKAALRSTDWTIPKVDHIRFLPQKKPFEVLVDDLGRKGLNTYIPAKIKAVQGDVTPWTDYLTRVFNNRSDIDIFNSYVAHCIKFPGWKIPWAIMVQSAKGIGKQMIGEVLKRSVGDMYTYQPDAEELVTGVSQFNGWMSNKILIIVDEVRVGDRNDLMNGLKTIITDRRIAIERKGVDQEMEDNVANWVFFSNFKDAFPIDENERRYCIFYSKLQSARAIAEAGLTKDYFDEMYNWLEKQDGYKKIAYWYLNYPVEKGSLPHRAPETSSYDEVIRIGRSPLRVLLDEKIESGERGFRGGYVSLTAFAKAVADSNMKTKPAEHTLRTIVEQKGYVELGKTKKPVLGEDITKPSVIYGLRGLTVDKYEGAQN